MSIEGYRIAERIKKYLYALPVRRLFWYMNGNHLFVCLGSSMASIEVPHEVGYWLTQR